jgi:two-component system, sensor histidine kinase and response regulator
MSTNAGVQRAFDIADLLDQLGGDQQLAEEIIGLFLQDCPQQLSAIKAAIDAGDSRQLYVVAHTLKGAAGALSAEAVADAARTLETLGREGRVTAAGDAWQSLEAEAARLFDALKSLGSGGLQDPSCAP